MDGVKSPAILRAPWTRSKGDNCEGSTDGDRALGSGRCRRMLRPPRRSLSRREQWMQRQGFTGILGPTGSSASSSDVPYKSVGLLMGPLCPFLASPRLGAGLGRAEHAAAVPRRLACTPRAACQG